MKIVATGAIHSLGVVTEQYKLISASVKNERIVTGGKVGPRGPKGDAGTPYEHLQSAPASTWIISHGLGHVPSVALYDDSGVQFFSDVTASSTVVTVTFPSPVAGKAVLT